MKLTSSAFKDGEMIPPLYTCEGAGTSPPLSIADVPVGTQSFALILEDPDAVGGTFDHWVLYDIAPGTAEILEGESLGTPGRNSGGGNDYYPPCPPRGHEPEEHRYSFHLYALDTLLGLRPGATKEELLRGLRGHTIEEEMLVGRYRKQQ